MSKDNLSDYSGKDCKLDQDLKSTIQFSGVPGNHGTPASVPVSSSGVLTHPNIEEHRSIIETYFSNGFNGKAAVKTLRPHLSDSSAQVTFATLVKQDHVKAMISEYKQAARASIAIEPEMVLRTLQTWLQVDPTQVIGLTIEEIRALPNEVKQCIQSIKHRKKEYTDRAGNLVTEENIEVRIVDKIKALEMINKHIGFYAEDNKQREVRIDLTKLDINILNQLSLAEIKRG